MSTGQSYLGKGDSTTLFELSAQIAPQITPSADDLSASSINLRIYEVQTRLLDLSDRFVTLGFEQGPAQAVGNLLTYWLVTPVNQRAAEADPGHILAVQLLINALNEIDSITSQPLIGPFPPIVSCLLRWKFINPIIHQ